LWATGRTISFIGTAGKVRSNQQEEVTDYLRSSDAANFRRSFKRWTGSTPNLIRQLF